MRPCFSDSLVLSQKVGSTKTGLKELKNTLAELQLYCIGISTIEKKFINTSLVFFSQGICITL